MSNIHNHGLVHKQVINPIIHGDLVIYGEVKIPRFLTKLPSLEDEIIGREHEIEDLRKSLEQSQRVVLMNGMGGIGKTTTAIAYANQYKDQYTHIVWIEQLSDLANDLVTNKLLCQNLGVHPSDDAVADTQLIFNRLANLGGKSLLVIDNADSQIQPFKDYLPKAPHWHVLLTSRQELSFAKILNLNFLSEPNALALFYQHYTKEQDDEAIKEILHSIDFHTLTIELLAKTAQKRKIVPIRRLKALLEEKGLKIDRRIGLSVGHSREKQVEELFPYLKAIFQLDESFSEQELSILKHFVALPSTFVPFQTLAEFLNWNEEDEATQDRFSDALAQLKEKGWLIHDEQHEAYKMHKIIQDVLQEYLQPTYAELETLVRGISSSLSIDQAKDNPIDKFAYVPYGERILLLFPDEQGESFSRFQSILALVYKALGRYEQAAELLEKALQSNLTNFGLSHPLTGRSQSNLALVYKALGRYEEAVQLLKEALQSDLANFGPHHTLTATSQSNLATVYQNLGRYEEALQLLKEALQSAEANFGPSHPSTAIRQSNLALVYKALGRYEEAAELLEKTLESNLANFGQNHPSIAISQSNLATVYQNLGRYEQAAELLEKALQSDLANFGPAHPSTTRRQSNLAAVYKYLRRYEEAAQLQEKALQSDLANFGSSHPSTAMSQSNLATVYQALGRYEEAAQLQEKALQSNLANFSQNHPEIARSQSNLATVYQNLGRYAEAVNLWRVAYRTYNEFFGTEHPNTKVVKEFLDTYDQE